MIFFWLLVSHVVMDFWAQSDALAMLKNRHKNTTGRLPWYYALFAHSLMHGAGVTYITGNIILGLIETVAHWSIDFSKCEGWIDIHIDQGLHVACKMLYFVWLTS